jgi:hypothetical protein
MKTPMLAFLILIAALLTGCLVTSVYPFYTEKDVHFETALLGEWRNAEDSDEQWKFERATNDSYRVTYTSGTNSSPMQARYFKIAGEGFLDLSTTEINDTILPLPIPAHALMRVFELTPTPRLAMLDYGWLAKLLEKNPKALRHHITQKAGETQDEGRLVLTADTAELQRFIRSHLKTEGAWKDSLKLIRGSGAEPPKKP